MAPSAFDIIVERSLTVTENGVGRALAVDEALWFKTYQDAIGGSRMAQREVMKMISKREQWLAERRPPPKIDLGRDEYPDQPNATPALRLLGIAEPDPSQRTELLLEPWAVEMALNRKGFEPHELPMRTMSICTRDGMALRQKYKATDREQW